MVTLVLQSPELDFASQGNNNDRNDSLHTGLVLYDFKSP